MTLSRDDLLGLGMIVLAAAYWAAADQIPVSLLSDAVGADGVPKVLAVALAICGALLLLTTRLKRQPAEAPSSDRDEKRAHLRAAGLLAGLVAYIFLLPVLGYPLAIALLIAAVAIYGGTRIRPSVAAVAVAGSALFWVFFVKILGIGMPTGIWAAGF